MSDRRDDWDDGDDREELDERVAELEARLRDLRTEMTRPPEGPMGLPRPPTPREVLSFTGEYAIPTVIAILEANIRALEMLQQVVRVIDPNHSVTKEGRERLESRAADASRATLDRLEGALGEIETAIEEGDLPREGEARDILQDARRINRDIRDRVRESSERADEARAERRRDLDRESRESRLDDDDFDDRGTTIELDGTDGDADEEDDDRGQVDVDAELRSIKDEIDGTDGDGTDDDDDDGETTDAADVTQNESESGDAADDGTNGDEDGDDSENGK